MSGFFTQAEIEETALKGYQPPSFGPECGICKLHLSCKSPKMNYTGEGKQKCLIILEAPGSVEDQVGEQLRGEIGIFFREALTNLRLDLNRDFWKINAINCWPHTPRGTNRTPTSEEIKCCRPMINKAIKELQPDTIWLMGGCAIESFLGERFSNRTVNRWRGLKIPDRNANAWILPMFHPSAAHRSERREDKNIKSVFKADLKYAIGELKKGKPTFDTESEYSKVKLLMEFQEVINALDKALLEEFFYFDYETTGIKPQRPGHKIACMSFANNTKSAFAFPYQYNNYWSIDELKSINKRLRRILDNPHIKKMAHSLTMENSWTHNIIGCEVNDWYWDTKLAAHILDNRSGYTGLKFQSYINFGLNPYNTNINQYLTSTTEFNRVEEAPIKDLLQYCGLDSLNGIKLFEKQAGVIYKNPSLLKAFDFFMEGQIELARVHENGIPINEEYYKEQFTSMGKELESLKHNLNTSKEAIKFKKETGYSIDWASPTQLKKLFYQILKYPETEITAKGNVSINEEALQKIDSPTSANLLILRKREKVRGTYLAQFVREVVDEKMYPIFGLYVPRSFRGSAYRPNFQNIPIRDRYSKRITRTGIIPSPGNKLVEADYSGIEVGTSCCYHKDRNMIKYVTDPSTDMHRDSACDIFILPEREITSDIRFHSKNGWVFPQFYGDWYASCAEDLWENCIHRTTVNGIKIREHLKNKGIYKLDDFKDHCQRIEYKFWNDRFPQYRDWKEEINKKYRRDGYIETFLGFQFRGYMGKKEATNYPIQGTAFHLLLWTLIRVTKIIRKMKLITRIIGQIHDSIVFDLYPPEMSTIIHILKDIGEKKIRERFDWIIVPLTLDFEESEIDGNWYQMKEVNNALITS